MRKNFFTFFASITRRTKKPTYKLIALYQNIYRYIMHARVPYYTVTKKKASKSAYIATTLNVRILDNYIRNHPLPNPEQPLKVLIAIDIKAAHIVPRTIQADPCIFTRIAIDNPLVLRSLLGPVLGFARIKNDIVRQLKIERISILFGHQGKLLGRFNNVGIIVLSYSRSKFLSHLAGPYR